MRVLIKCTNFIVFVFYLLKVKHTKPTTKVVDIAQITIIFSVDKTKV